MTGKDRESVAGGDVDVDVGGLADPGDAIPPALMPYDPETELPSPLAELGVDSDGELPRPTPLLPMPPTVEPGAPVFGIEGERELEGGRSACPALTLGIVLAEEDSASRNRGADSRRSVTPLSAALSAGRWGDSSDLLSVDRSASLECTGSPPGGLSGGDPILCPNRTVSA